MYANPIQITILTAAQIQISQTWNLRQKFIAALPFGIGRSISGASQRAG
jgi:hypothetical protein